MNTDNERKKNFRGRTSYIIIFILVIILIYLVYLLFTDNNTYSIVLKGDNPFYLIMGEEYLEAGYEAYNQDMLNVTKNVQVQNTIDNMKVGEYDVIYSIGREKVYRKVIVTDKKLNIILSLSEENLTKKDLFINVKVVGRTLKKIVLPDESESNELELKYQVSTNGEYLFKAYNSDGEIFEEKIEVTNIDKEAPTGTCKAVIDMDKSEIVVNATDNNEIKEYNYLEKGISVYKGKENSYTHTGKLSKLLRVLVADTVGNIGELSCDVYDHTILSPIKPTSTDKVTFQEETDTLKVYVIRRDGYYLTRIWAENPYMQLNKYDSPLYGKELFTPSILLEKAMNENKLTDKLLLGFNASGFYLKDTYDAYSVSKYPAYDKTSVGSLVITNGKVIRNAYDKAFKTWFIMGINPDNQMVIFEDTKATTTDEIASKQKWANNVINSKIRNTYTFASPVIENGVKTNNTTSMPTDNSEEVGLQMICQINSNNFLLFTSSGETRKKGINVFLGEGCKTATNLDGGGSIALIYKERNSSEIKKIIGGSRALPEVAYFVEE